MTLQQWFTLGMKRDLPELLEADMSGTQLEIGQGNNPICGTMHLPSDWRAPSDMDILDESISAIWAHHFMEHLTGTDALSTLREMERVLLPGGMINLVIPYYSSQMQHQDLDHKSEWTEGTFKSMFDNPHYDDKGEWKLNVHFCCIMGIVEKNLSLFVQLQKDLV